MIYQASIFIDLKNFYGNYTDSWLWKCTFVLDSFCKFDEVIFEDIQSVQLSTCENIALKEYLYNYISNEEALA